ncbi:nucleotidyltransferase [Roseateles sp. So40a]|uniref:nucleotidyltransferase domain-containing protein n=1 Tax=Roseateles sp. So40a TaxID=3400226 RepID=UPI003A895ABB
MRTTRSVTPEAMRRFNYLTETIAAAYEPTATQLQTLERAYGATGEYLTTCAEFDGLLTAVHAHGSRQLGTIVRPMDSQRSGFDIDLVARLARSAMFRYQGQEGVARLLQHLFQALARYAERHGLAIKRWERCVTLTYADGMCADFAPVIDEPLHTVERGEHHGRIPDREARRYLSTNPKGYCLAFEDVARISPMLRNVATVDFAQNAKRADVEPLPDAQQVMGRLLCRLVQLAKVHRNVMFGRVAGGDKLAPSSVFLTSLLAKAYAIEARLPHDGPLDLFLDMLARVPTLFDRQSDGLSERWVLLNPCAQNDNLAESMNSTARQAAFRQWHAMLMADVEELTIRADGAGGLSSVVKSVERSFGARAGQAVLQRGSQQREDYRTLGKAGFVVAGAVPVVASARGHTYFGGPEA